MKKTKKKSKKTKTGILSRPISFAIIVGAIGSAITCIIKAFANCFTKKES